MIDVRGIIPGQVVLSCMKKQAEQAMVFSLFPASRFLIEFLPRLHLMMGCDLEV